MAQTAAANSMAAVAEARLVANLSWDERFGPSTVHPTFRETVVITPGTPSGGHGGGS